MATAPTISPQRRRPATGRRPRPLKEAMELLRQVKNLMSQTPLRALSRRGHLTRELLRRPAKRSRSRPRRRLQTPVGRQWHATAVRRGDLPQGSNAFGIYFGDVVRVPNETRARA